MYLMKTPLKNGQDYESTPRFAEYGDATERSLVLYAVRDALERFKYACNVTVHTECSYIESVLSQGWLEKWQCNGWKTRKGGDIKDAVLWSMVLVQLEEGGHILTAKAERHEYADWMRFNMQLAPAYEDTFCDFPKQA